MNDDILPTPKSLTILVNHLRDNTVFAFEVQSRRWLRQQFPWLHIAPQISIGQDPNFESPTLIHNLSEEILTPLGVSPQRLAKAGVRSVRFVDVETEEVTNLWIFGTPPPVIEAAPVDELKRFALWLIHRGLAKYEDYEGVVGDFLHDGIDLEIEDEDGY